MLIKRKGGFVFVVLVLFVFSVFFVSAIYFGPQHTQVVSNYFRSPDGSYFEYTLPNAMNVSTLLLVADLPSQGTNCKFNLSVFDSSENSIETYIDPTTLYSTINTKFPAYQSITYSFIATTGIKIAPREVKRVRIHSTSSCLNIGTKVNLANLSVIGQYSLPVVNQSFSQLPLVAGNSSIEIPLTAPSYLELTNVDLNLTAISSSGSCPIFVYVVSDSKRTIINGAGYNLGAAAQGSNIQLSYPISAPYLNTRLIINTSTFIGTGANKVMCYAGKLNLTGVFVSGRVTSVCTSNYQTTYTSCNSSNQRIKTISDLNGCVLNISSVESCDVESCTLKCGNISSALSSPSIAQFPPSCLYRGNCDYNILIGNENSPGIVYDLVWKYNYYEGDSVEICACNGTEVVSGHPVRVSNPSVSLRVDDNNTRIISSVELKVYAYNGTIRSGYSTYTLQNITYLCSNGCSSLGVNSEIEDMDPTNYLACERVANSVCFNETVKTCSTNTAYMFFDSSLGLCANRGTYSCPSGPSSFCNVSTRSLTNASSVSATYTTMCGLNGLNIGCYRCDSGFKYDADRGYCVSNNCMIQGNADNLCSSNGGVCNNSLTYGGFSHANITLDCCNGDFTCFQCNSGAHFYNGSCVSDNCANGDNFLPLGANNTYTLGANSTNSSSINMTWSYINGAVGACQWTCSYGYELNLSTNRSCKERVVSPCASIGGVCSSTNISNSVVDVFGNCSVGSCYTCNSGFISNGVACVQRSCADEGKIDNGVGCVGNLSGCDGCILEKNGVSRCVGAGFKVEILGVKKYCDLETHTFKNVLTENQACTSGAQCASGFCFQNATISYCQDLTKVGGLQETIIKFVCWFTTIGQGEGAYNSCKANRALQYLT